MIPELLQISKQRYAIVDALDLFCFQTYFGGAFARYYLAFNILGLCCCTGMSYMFKKSMLDELNGLNWYGRYLAEDFFLTHALHEK